MSNFGLFDIIIGLTGIYMIYSIMQIKKTGDLTGSQLVSKQYDVTKAKDPQGFIDCIYKKTLLLGVAVVIGAAVDYFNEVYFGITAVSLGIVVFFVAIVGVYCWFSMKAQKKYLSPKQRDQYGRLVDK